MAGLAFVAAVGFAICFRGLDAEEDKLNDLAASAAVGKGRLHANEPGVIPAKEDA